MINIGDEVNVYWEYVPCEYKLKVVYIPLNAGDYWHFERVDGIAVIVNNFCKIEKYKEN